MLLMDILIFLVVLGVMIFCGQPTKQAIQREQALQLVASRFEELKAKELPVGELEPEIVEQNGVSYKVLAGLAEVPGYPKTLRQLTVEVRWDKFSTQQNGWVSGARF